MFIFLLLEYLASNGIEKVNVVTDIRLVGYVRVAGIHFEWKQFIICTIILTFLLTSMTRKVFDFIVLSTTISLFECKNE